MLQGSRLVRALVFVNVGALLFGFLRIWPSLVPTVRYIDVGKERCVNGSYYSIETDAEFPVPNIAHYIWYNTDPAPLQFHHMLSVLSVHKIMKPEKIYFHTNIEPTGPYWEQIKTLPRFIINYREPPVELFGDKIKPPMYYTSHSNVDRTKILSEYGGVYLDFDTFVLRPLEDLRRYECTIGLEQPTKACGSIIICAPKALFLLMWLNSYIDDYREEWAYNTGQVPANLARRFPHLVHVETSRLNRPNFEELDQIWGPNTFDWRNNYALHIWYRIWKDMSPYYDGTEPDPITIKSMNNTFGQIARTIYYGKPELMSRKT